MANRLGEASSPYLLQHAGNPVHWQQWTPEALAEAARRDVPILLSIGYAACHWCHVMAHESFEDAEVAAAVNANFVCIKVDREERPDLDAVYMNATVALTGQGGWPMTCFLTPDGRPFFCGTYYPKVQFLQLLSAVGETWRERRGEVEQASDQITGELRKMAAGLPNGGPPASAELCDHAVPPCWGTRTPCAAGSRRPRGAPKFPPSALLEALLRTYERTGSADVLGAVERTCTAMARGGIYDQLAGGFARYSVDNAWVVPHFEKMLYDNALLLRVYAHWARRTGSALAHRIAGETADFLLQRPRRRRPVHLVAGRRRRRPRGLHLRVDACATVRCARRRRRALGGKRFRCYPGGYLRTRRVGAATAGRRRLTPDGWTGSGPLCWRPAAAASSRPATTRSSPLERAGDHRAGRGVSGAGPARTARRPRVRCATAPAGLAPRRWTAAARQPGRGRRRQRRHPRGLRGVGDGPGHAVSAHRRAALADGRRRADRHRPGAFRGPGPSRSMVRHRRRRRGADGAPGRSRRRRDTGGCLVDHRGDS